MGVPRFYPLPDEVERAFAGAGLIAIEIDARARWAALQAAFAAHTRLPEGRTLEQVAPPGLAARARKAFSADDAEWRGLRRLQPWALSIRLISTDDRSIEASTTWGHEAHFLARAAQRRLPVLELESVDEQVALFTGGSLDEQLAELALRLARLDDWDRTLHRLLDAWRTGDTAALQALKDDAYGRRDDPVLGSLRQRLFGERDARLAARLAAAASPAAPLFAVLGAFHLVGDGNVGQQLEQHGFRLSRVPTGTAVRASRPVS